jgi:hypothetical protein
MSIRKRYSLNHFKRILNECWSKDTCFPEMEKDWNEKNPALGQCAITAIIIQDYFSGYILYCCHNKRYWNRLPDGKEVAFTRSQFNDKTKG